jgi:AraC-like DNA-binding protein
MSSHNRTPRITPEIDLAGLYRLIMSGGGSCSLAELKRSPRVCRVLEHSAHDLLSARVRLAPGEGEGYWEVTRVRDDFSITMLHLTYDSPRAEFEIKDGRVRFNFILSGDLSYRVSRPDGGRSNSSSLQVWRHQQRVGRSTRKSPCSHHPRLTISVRPDFMLEHLLPSSGDVPSSLRAFVSTPRRPSNECQLPLTAQMTEIATKLIHNPHQGRLCLTYIEALALQLLCFAIANFWSLPDQASEEYSARELRALRTVRQVLIGQTTPGRAMRNIAESVGLGEKALERGFTTVYGETLSDFDLRCRMQRALCLLRDCGWSVDRVREVLGYSDSTSFVTAFYRHFGRRPINLQGTSPDAPDLLRQA